MGWLTFWRDWRKGDLWPAWEPTPSHLATIIAHPTAHRTQAEWSGEQVRPEGNARAVTPSISVPSRSDVVSDGKNVSGDVTTETTHASSLPRHTWRVFPSAANHRNAYDSQASVVRAVAARKRRPHDYDAPGGDVEPIKVYRAETWWIDVTDEFLKS